MWVNRGLLALRQLATGGLLSHTYFSLGRDHKTPSPSAPLGEHSSDPDRSTTDRAHKERDRIASLYSGFVRNTGTERALPPPPHSTSGGPGQRRAGEVVPARTGSISLPTVEPVAVSMLSPRASSFLGSGLLLEPLPSLTDIINDIPSYTDPALKKGGQRTHLLSRLVEGGLLRPVATRRLPLDVPFFTVAKSGAGERWQRLVCDLRQLNACFRPAPPVNLGSVEALACLDLSHFDQERLSLSVAGGDIQVWFYSILLPTELHDLFTVPETVGELKAACAARGLTVPLRLADAPPEAHLGFAVPLMGWSLAPYIAQLALEDLLAAAVPAQLGDLSRVSHLGPVPRLEFEGDVVHYEYLDDFGILALQSVSHALAAVATPEASRLAAQIKRHLEDLGLRVHKEQEGLPLESLGVCLDRVPRGGRVFEYFLAPKQSRCARLYFDTADMVEAGSATPRALATLLGVWSWSALVFRPFLSIFSAVYRFLAKHFPTTPDDVMELWPDVRDELATAASLLPLLRAPLSADWHTEVACVDAGPDFGAVVVADLPRDMVASAGARGLRSGWSTHLTGSSPDDDDESSTEHDECGAPLVPRGLPPPPIEDDVMTAAAWRLAYTQTWRTDEHNNAGELRILVGALRRASRAVSEKRVLLLTDSLVAMGALLKGRSSNRTLLRLCRQALATCLATGTRFAIRYVPTWLNVADGPSRAVSRVGVARDTISKAVQKYRRRGGDVPSSLIDAARNAGLDVDDLLE